MKNRYRTAFCKALLATFLALCAAQAGAAEERRGEVHGFISQGYVKSTSGTGFPVGHSGRDSGTFEFNDIAINYTTQPLPNLRVGVQLFAQHRGSYGDDELQVDWAFGDYRISDAIGFRAGKIKMPSGLYNTSRDNDALRNAIFLPQGVYNDYYRDLASSILGAGFYGSLRGGLGTLRYEIYGGTLPFTKKSAIAAAFNSIEAHAGTTGSAGLIWEPLFADLRFGITHTRMSARGASIVSASLPPIDWLFDNYHSTILSAEYTRERVTVAAEYQREDHLFYISPGPLLSFHGASWYVSGAYRFTDWLEVGTYYNLTCSYRGHCGGSTYAQFGTSRPASMYQRDLALTLRFDVLPQLVVKVEGHRMKGYGLDIMTSTDTLPVNWNLLAVKSTFSF